METNALAALLARRECDTLDFKERQYDLGSNEGKADLVKDLICMANTPREESAHILVGVREGPDGRVEAVVGVGEHPDDANVRSLVRSRVHPLPVFAYDVVDVEGKQIGVFVLPPERRGSPHFPVRDCGGKLRQHQLYWRSGTQNTAATPDEQQRIWRWFTPGDANSCSSADSRRSPEPAWDAFLSACSSFEPGRIYMLAIDRAEHPEPLAGLGYADWAAVVDLDPGSDTDGTMSVVQPVLAARRQVHLMLPGDTVTMNLSRGTYWLLARGHSRRPATIPQENWRAWNIMYGRGVQQFFDQLARSSGSAPLTFVSAVRDMTYAGSMLESAQASFGERAELVIVASDEGVRRTTSTQFAASAVDISDAGMANGLARHFRQQREYAASDRLVPSRDGIPVEVPRLEVPWLEEELEILHLGAGNAEQPGRETGKAFLLGSTPTWYELGLHFDVDRQIAQRVIETVRYDLDNRITGRVNLYHEPGAGGTTVARRVAWDLHELYPTVLLHGASVGETPERLARLADLTGSAVLVVAEGADLLDRDIDDLVSGVLARQTPVVILQVLRRFGRQESRGRAFWLSGELGDAEAERFAYVYAKEAPDRQHRLRALAGQGGQQRAPFYFGLEAFGRQFRGLPNYVSTRLAAVSGLQQRLLAFTALGHHYGQQTIELQAFGHFLGIPASRTVGYEEVFAAPARELLVLENGRECRTAHNLVAQEILRQVLGGAGSEGHAWKQNLSLWVNRFLEFCRGPAPVVSDEAMELVRRVIIYRDNTELLGTERSGSSRFSQLIEDIPSDEGRLVVLTKLTELFPEEAHFWAHLGRFRYMQLKEFSEGLSDLDRAVDCSPRDHVLRHMRGMLLRSLMFDAVKTDSPLNNVLGLAVRASAEFEAARSLQPHDEHGYVSEIQMLTTLMEYAARTEDAPPAAVLARPNTDPRLRDALDRAEDLFYQLRSLSQGESESPYEQACRIRLHSLYGDHAAVLRGYNDLLARPDVHAPPVRRQLVWTYVDRAGRSWHSLPQEEVRRIVALLEENLIEEPNEGRNIKMWTRAVRRLQPPPSLETVIERVAFWRSNTEELEATYYLYVFHALKALQGSTSSVDEAKRFIQESKGKAQQFYYRTKSFEWLGHGLGVSRLVHHFELGDWDDSSSFWEKTGALERIGGTIVELKGPQAGRIELACGLTAFFVPQASGIARGRDENKGVTFFLGFSYEGLRAWSVELVDPGA